MQNQEQRSKRYLSAGQVKKRYGDVTDMTIRRWLKSPTLGFPQPVRFGGRFRFWDEDELDAYDRECGRRCAGMPTPRTGAPAPEAA